MQGYLVNNILKYFKIISLLILFIFVLIAGFFLFFINQSHQNSNEYAKQSSLVIYESLMQKQVESLSTLNVDYSHWTQAVEAFSGEINEDFIDQNYDGESLKEAYSVDALAIYQLDGRLKMTISDESRDAVPNPEFEGDEFKKMFELALKIDPESPTAISSYISFEGQPHIVDATIVTPNVLNEEFTEYKAHGVSMMLRKIDQSLFDDWESNFKLNSIQISELDQVTVPGFMSVTLKDPWGKNIYKVQWQPDLPGDTFLNELWPVALVILSLIGVISAIFAFHLKGYIKMTLQAAEELREHGDLLLKLAHYDSITGLPNRVLGMTKLEEALDESVETNTFTALLFIDLDRFKPVNDTYGHHIGDKMLKQIGHILESCIRKGVDTVSRIGGDEFIVILSKLRNKNDAVMVAEKIIDALSKDIYIDDLCLNVGASIGICVDTSGTASPIAIVKKADVAMYAAKESGKNTYQIA